MATRFGTSAYRRIAMAAGASVLALGIAAPALAQNADEETGNREIVVTAQFREQKLQDTPLSITAVDAELLESRNQTDLGQIARQAPNVTLNAMGGAYGSSLGASIRGIGQFDFNPAYEPGVGMYIDDVYYATLTGGIFDLLDLERVEVLRGPQGTLTGRNSIGGAIKLFSRSPDDENSGTVQATYGGRKRMEFRASANFVLAEGLYARVSAVHKQQDGYVDQVDYGCARPGNPEGVGAFPSTDPKGCVMSKLGEINYSGIRGALRWNPSEAWDYTITADYTREDRSNAAEVVTTASAAVANSICGPFCTYASFYLPAGGQVSAGYFMPNTTKFDGWGISGNGTYTFSDSLNLQTITAYRRYRQIWGTDDDFTPFSGKGAGQTVRWLT